MSPPIHYTVYTNTDCLMHLFSILYILACGSHEHTHVELPEGDATIGEELYIVSCSGCHNADGLGGYGGPNLLGHPEDHIVDYVQNGKGNMPAFPDYTKQDLADIIAHIRVLEESD